MATAQRMGTAFEVIAGRASIAGVVLYTVAVIAAAAGTPGYGHLSHLISELGAVGAPWAVPFRAVVFSVGVVAFLLAAALYRSLGGWGGPLCVAIIGACLLVGGIYPCDARCVPTTVPGWLHILSGIPGTLASAIGPVLVARRQRRDPRWASWAPLSMACGIATAVLVLPTLFVFPPLGLDGLGQRLLTGVPLFWFGAMGVALERIEGQ